MARNGSAQAGATVLLWCCYGVATLNQLDVAAGGAQRLCAQVRSRAAARVARAGLGGGAAKELSSSQKSPTNSPLTTKRALENSVLITRRAPQIAL